MRPAAASALRRIRGVPLPLRLILAVAAVEVLCWVAVAPPWQGPDESAHFAYAQHFAEVGHAPATTFPQTGVGAVSTQQGSAESWFNLRSAVGILGSKPLFTSADKHGWERLEQQLPPTARSDGYGPNAQAQNPPLYYAFQALPYKVVGADHILTTAFWMRLWTGVLFLLTVAFTWLAAGELFGPRRWLQALAAGAVALLPQLAYMNSIVNADGALACTWSAFTWLALRLLRRGPSPGRLLAVGLVVAISIVTHGRGLPLAAPGALAVVLAFARRPRISLPLVLGCVGALALVVGALAWSFHITASAGGSAYGGEAHFGAGASFTLKGFVDYVWQFYFPRLPGMAPKIGPAYGFDQVFILSFFGLFASLEVGYPGWVYDLLHTASLVGLVALIAALWVHRRGVIRRWDMLAVMAAMVVALLFVLHYVAYRDMLGQPGDPVLVGRYILPLVSVFALAIATVASALPRRVGIVFGALVLSAGLLLQLGGLGVTLVRFYA